MTSLVDLLRRVGAEDDRLVHLEHLPARPARTADWPSWADPDLVAGYRRLGVALPWTHQVTAAQAVHEGRHTAVATGTGSGKSMAVWLPVLSAVRAGALAAVGPYAGSIARHTRRPTALYLAPTKALAHDQATALEGLLAASSLTSVRVATCDGDTPDTERDWAREHADVVLTNPDFVHYSVLPSRRRWERVLRGLSVVVVDEAHAYRGVLGAHVALVVRRLLRVARHLGADPAVVCLSATSAEPGVAAARIIGTSTDEVVVVDDDASPAGDRYLALWQPAPADRWGAGIASSGSASSEPSRVGAAPAAAATSPGGPPVPLVDDAPRGDSDDDPWALPADAVAAEEEVLDRAEVDEVERRSALAECAELVADLVPAGARTLAFVRSRRGAEALAESARRHLALVSPALVDTVRAYRGGYLPEERRALEARLRSGEVLAMATTNALELGIDVSGLDAVLLCGWPGSRASMWQQAGRAGRAGADGVAVLVASADPLDSFLVHHPEAVLGEPVEATVFDPSNPHVLAPHLCAAAAELPLTAEDLALFGIEDERGRALLDHLVDTLGLLRRRPTGWYWDVANTVRAQDLTSLRGSTERQVQIVESATGTVLGTVDAGNADTTVHPGAVYVHQGRVLLVETRVDDVAMVTDGAHLPYRTRARSSSSVRFLSEEAVVERGGVRWSTGEVEITGQVDSFVRYRVPDQRQIGVEQLDLDARTFRTVGTWWTLDEAALEAAGVDPGRLGGALHAAEHASIGMLPLLATCDRWDIGGLSTEAHDQTGRPTVVVHDGFPGGAGFARRGFDASVEWVRATLETVRTCPCVAGCPRCVQSPKCGNGNSPLDKAGAIALLTVLAGAAERHPEAEAYAPPTGDL
ncbi:DEAD/DEAH box helicase [Georgenia sp. Z1491]|uniref:DEAD/DEAH box helicase n=1 Tax=Georgenia sp. Z1491 TaxID=3416707 RepID=UPI003CF99639